MSNEVIMKLAFDDKVNRKFKENGEHIGVFTIVPKREYKLGVLLNDYENMNRLEMVYLGQSRIDALPLFKVNLDNLYDDLALIEIVRSGYILENGSELSNDIEVTLITALEDKTTSQVF